MNELSKETQDVIRFALRVKVGVFHELLVSEQDLIIRGWILSQLESIQAALNEFEAAL